MSNEPMELEAATLDAYNATIDWFTDGHDDWPATSDVCGWRSLLAEDPLILDVGCGFGRAVATLETLGITRYIGVDPCAGLIDVARKRNQGKDFRIGNALDLLTVVPEKCDGFVAAWLLMHIERSHIDQLLQGIRSVMKRGAVGYLISPYGTEEDVGTHAQMPHLPEGHRVLFVEWTFETITPHLVKAGFELIEPMEAREHVFWFCVRAV